MSWDDDFYREMEELDDYDYVNKLGIYAEEEPEEDPNDELYSYGLDPDDLEDMDEYRRNRVIENAGLDPDDYTFYGTSSGRTSTYRSAGAAASYPGNPGTYQRSASTKPNQPVQSTSSNGKWGVLTFIGIITVISIIGFAAAAFGGQILGAIVVIAIGIFILACF